MTTQEFVQSILRDHRVAVRALNVLENADLVTYDHALSKLGVNNQWGIGWCWWNKRVLHTAVVDFEKLKSMMMDKSILRVRNMGRKTFTLLANTLGIPDLSDEKIRCKTCGRPLPASLLTENHEPAKP